MTSTTPDNAANGHDLLADTEAVVLVGGKGTRLRPLTLSAPKPMLPTAGLPFLTHLLSRIRAAGIRRVVLGTSFKAEVFEEYFGDGSELGLDISYVVETEPLGTGGGIRNVLPALTASTVMVFNGEVIGGKTETMARPQRRDRDGERRPEGGDRPNRRRPTARRRTGGE